VASWKGFLRLFGSDVRVLVAHRSREELKRVLDTDSSRGWTVDGSGPPVTADQLRPPAPLRYLYEYLLASGFLLAMPPR